MENKKSKRPYRTDCDKNFQGHVHLLFNCFSWSCSFKLLDKAMFFEKLTKNMHFSCQNVFPVREFQEIGNDLKNRAHSADPPAKARDLQIETVRHRKSASWIRKFPVLQDIFVTLFIQIRIGFY